MISKIKVDNSGIIKLRSINDYPDGNLIVAEMMRNIPFNIKRFYVITGFDSDKSIRGKHAHKKLEQAIFCLHGSFILKLDDGRKKQKILMNNPLVGIKLGKRLWSSMSHFTKNCVILVIANDYYKESDYIRSYDDFLKSFK